MCPWYVKQRRLIHPVAMEVAMEVTMEESYSGGFKRLLRRLLYRGRQKQKATEGSINFVSNQHSVFRGTYANSFIQGNHRPLIYLTGREGEGEEKGKEVKEEDGKNKTKRRRKKIKREKEKRGKTQ